MLHDLFVEHVWIAILFYVILSILDYRLSLLGLRWFRKGADAHYDFGGSYELNPPFEEDIEAQRPVSLRHLVSLARGVVIIAAVWWFTARADRLEDVYVGVVGFFVLVLVPVLIRHVNNLALFRFVALRGGVEGRVETPRWMDLKLSAVLFWLFACVYAALYVIVGDAFFLGGVVGGALVGARFWIFGGEAEKEPAGQVGGTPAEPTVVPNDGEESV